MDPVIDNEWLGCKNEPIDEIQNVGNIARSWQWRERGINPPNYPNSKTVLENMAEDTLVQKPLQIRSCDLPGYPRSTFLMVFSPDGTKVASTHGNHNVYVSELASGKHVRILKGHPRTPWCIAFHPSHPLLIGSGCLGGQVRVWDIASGGSEVWNVRNETVIASIAFHPREQLLVIATFNELYFWDWSKPAPFTKVSTNNPNEKVRFVAFDALGYKLITGISLWAGAGGPANNSAQQQNPASGPTNNPNNNNSRRDDNDDSPGGSRAQESPGSAQDMIVNSYQNLVQRYDSLVRNYQRLFMVRHRLTNTPPPPNTTDRGTDPMDTDFGLSSSGWIRATRSVIPSQDDANPTPSTSRDPVEPSDTGDGEGSSRLLNLDVLSIDSNPSRNPSSSNQERSLFGSRSSAFQPLNGSDRSYRTIEYESTRLLPNPFSSSNGTPRPTRVTFTEITPSSSTNTSRTSIFTSSRGSSLGRDFSLRRRNFSPLQQNTESTRNDPATAATSPSALPFVPRRSFQTSASSGSQPSTSGSSSSSSQRPTMTNSSTQMSPVTAPVDAQTINESLDLIRDILRDSGTRLLNLITNMSLSTLASVERSIPRRGSASRAHSDESESGGRTRGGRPRVRLFSSTWRREFLSSSSDSDSDQSSEVNIFRTRNTTFREDESRVNDRLSGDIDRQSAVNDRSSASTSSERLLHPTDRLVFELIDETRNSAPPTEAGPSREAGGINVSLSNNRFRVRTQSDSMGTDIGPSSVPVASSATSAGAMPTPAVAAPAPVAATPTAATHTAATHTAATHTAATHTAATPTAATHTAATHTAATHTAATHTAATHTAATPTAATHTAATHTAATHTAATHTAATPTAAAHTAATPTAATHTAATPTAATHTAATPTAATHTAATTTAATHTAATPTAATHTAATPTAATHTAATPTAATHTAATPTATEAAPAEVGNEADGPSTSEPRTQRTSDFNPDRPSTSRDDIWNRGEAVPPDEAYRKVKSGVLALQKHTVQLTNLWLRGNRTTMRELRGMWENLRRRILMLHRETGRQDVPSYYTRPLLDRCMMLTDMTDNLTRTARNLRNNARNEDSDRHSTGSRNAPQNPNNENNNQTEPDRITSNDNATESRPTQGGRPSHVRSSPNTRFSPPLRRRVQSNYRWRAEDELRRRCRNPTANRLAPRYTNRSRRDFARAIEISATRHEIRMRAMQVLSVMFNMMMMCLEERGLSQLIISMLRTLKRALALTCLIVMSNRNNTRTATSQAPTPQRVESLDVVRIQNVEHNVDVNVDGPDELAPPSNQQRAAESVANRQQQNSKDNKTKTAEKPSTSHAETVEKNNKNKRPHEETPSTSQNSQRSRISQRYSNRVAVQIAAANRNNSATARSRRDLYMETRRQKALHRTNPTAHPLIKKRVLPPVSNYRIPALRSLPLRPSVSRFRSPRVDPQNNEPVAGPSNAPPPGDNPNLQESPGSELMNEFEHRVNFIRIAHMQAVRLRNAARNRFRRLQTIRLYTPSSVREMFSLPANNADNAAPGASPGPSGAGGAAEGAARHPLAMFRPHILAGRDPAGREELSHQFHTVLNNVAMPLMQMSDLPGNDGGSAQRLPRIHEYLQPIILAQNAMVVDDEVGAGEAGPRRLASMAGLLDAGIISEALPAPSHRVQAWDFTTGSTPEIADSTKNVVVQRCRIHNDASIDISKDGRLLVALLPVARLRNTNHWLGVYSLEWARLGQCLHTAVLEQSAVSVALSPTARHLAVGLGSRRFTTAPHARNNVIALLYRLEPLESSSRTGLSPIKELEQNWEHGFTSLNCLRWAPQPGQGLVYANNTGQLIIMS